MSAELFGARLGRAEVRPNDRTWMPTWLDEYAGRQDQRGGDVPGIDQETVLGFLRSLRDRGASAWQRPQAARALEWYPSLVLDRGDVDFAPFKR